MMKTIKEFLICLDRAESIIGEIWYFCMHLPKLQNMIGQPYLQKTFDKLWAHSYKALSLKFC